MKRILLAVSVLALTACKVEQTESKTVVDQCLRAQLFDRCLKTIPQGPLATKYNDWDEVVNECGGHSRSQSYRLRETVKLECRAD